MSELTALSPLDGRYAARLAQLRELCSEEGLIRQRVRVEALWLAHLTGIPQITPLRSLSPEVEEEIHGLATDSGSIDAAAVKALEKKINHDVKAVEYYVRERLAAAGMTPAQQEFVHFACTSEDINNLAYAQMLNEAREH